jgi:uncharacterized protein YndB with AHSA1/START domain
VPSPAEVTVVTPVRASAPEVWHALTDVDALAGWFGQLESPLGAEEMTKLTLIDGDFFVVQLVGREPPSTLAYQWAPMGVGTDTTISWRITPEPGGCRVGVTDTEPGRTPDQARRDARRWSAIVDRLVRFLDGGGPIGAVCGDAFDASMELPATIEGVTELLLAPAVHERWLPLDEGPFALVADRAARTLSFAVAAPGWRRATRCVLEASPRSGGAMLAVRHDGFTAISADVGDQQAARRRWCQLWGRSMRRFAMVYMRGRDLPAIPARELEARLGEPGLHVFDTNVDARWAEGHVAGATHIGPEPFTPDVLPSDRAATLVFYCLSPF